ncbi:Mce protein [Mycobacterium sp. SMC-11]|uniref:Mce protein n=1 Tax=Mycobacterium sp. SMC-11 TaxID=3385969 RepID=UPI00390C68D8
MSDREDEQAADHVEPPAEAVETVDAEAVENVETDSAETESAESVAADETAGEAAGFKERIGSLKPNRRWVAAAVLALGLIGATYEGWLLFAHHQRTVAAAQALEAAEKYTLTLTSVDPTAIDKNFAEILDGATGEFKDVYRASSEQLRQLLIDNKASAHGTVIDSAVKSATKNKVEVLLFVDQSVSNKTAPQAQIDRSRIVITMEKVKGRWLAANVEMP